MSPSHNAKRFPFWFEYLPLGVLELQKGKSDNNNNLLWLAAGWIKGKYLSNHSQHRGMSSQRGNLWLDATMVAGVGGSASAAWFKANNWNYTHTRTHTRSWTQQVWLQTANFNTRKCYLALWSSSSSSLQVCLLNLIDFYAQSKNRLRQVVYEQEWEIILNDNCEVCCT